ncbi:MAG: alginate lyase family protein [Candidatus Korobacteraceae bacterium]
MSAKVSRITRAVREDSVGALALEAVLRVSRKIRLSRFQAEIEQIPELQYRPLGYYKPVLHAISPEQREVIVSFADRVLAGEFPLMGYGNVALGSPPDWSRDWVSGKGWAAAPAQSLTVVRHDGSDVKAPWELSRLQFLPVLAKANLVTGEEKYRTAARKLVADWIDRNPVGIGVNWTLAMESALRGVSLCLLLELMWPLRSDEDAWLAKVTRSLWQHLRFTEAYSEFSHLVRSNHYLSNIVGLTTMSAALRDVDAGKRFRRYAQAVQHEILVQTYADGGDWEASTGYHVFVSQMFMHSYLVQRGQGIPLDPRFEQRLAAMFKWIATLADTDGTLPHLGDCDDGRVELLLDDIQQAALPAKQRNSLRLSNYLGLGSHLFGDQLGGSSGEAAWFGGQSRSKPGTRRPRVELLANSGLAVARDDDASLIFAAMPNGINGRGSHTHSDKLTFVLRLADGEVFCDSGTRCYTRDAALRNRYRAAAAHNVLTVDQHDQNGITSDTDHLFHSGNEAAVTPIEVNAQNGAIVFSASHSGYDHVGVRCSRAVHFKRGSFVIKDEIHGPDHHRIDLFFQLAPGWTASAEESHGTTVACKITGSRILTMTCEGGDRVMYLELEDSEISRAYGVALPAARIHIHAFGELPATLLTTIHWGN